MPPKRRNKQIQVAGLAEAMASAARSMAALIEESLAVADGDGGIVELPGGSGVHCLHVASPKEFADTCAQTITCCLLAAEAHHPSEGSLDIQKAIAGASPILRGFFQALPGLGLEGEIARISGELAGKFASMGLRAAMEELRRAGPGADPLIHLYEDFLASYDPGLRKRRGVWYTPLPVVGFIVRAVDAVLQNDFGLQRGLADGSLIPAELGGMGKDGTREMVPKLRILDPATGTGTFLAETVRLVHEKFNDRPDQWQNYAQRHLVPSLHGFEILPAPCAMAHINLGQILAATGYKGAGGQSLSVHQTDSLEEPRTGADSQAARLLAGLAGGGSGAGPDGPVLVIMGNPPYSGGSHNKGKWIMALMEDYKREPGTNDRLAERNGKWLNDDYVKFIRLGQYLADGNQSAVLAYVTNHGFLDNPTFRGMRRSLMESFDKIYIVDLHGNATKKETAPGGEKDGNVFDIRQGVSIGIFVKTGKKEKGSLAEIHHHGIYGPRQFKHGYLMQNGLADIPFAKLQPVGPEYFFVPKDYGGKQEYDQGFSVAELFLVNSVGVVTARDGFTIHESPEAVRKLIADFLSLSDEKARKKYGLGKDTRDWSVAGARADLESSGHAVVPVAYRPFDTRFTSYSGSPGGFHCRPRRDVMRHFVEGAIVPIAYRPFDTRYTRYSGVTKGFHCMPRREVMGHLAAGWNVGLVVGRQGQVVGPMPWNLVFVTTTITDLNLYYRGGSVVFPLYLFGEGGTAPNLEPGIVGRFAEGLGLEFETEKTGHKKKFAPIDVLDYVYAVLHSPSYRESYKEFLKTGFPRVPYPTAPKAFRRLAALGAGLRELHLMGHPALDREITSYPAHGDDVVGRIRWEPVGDGLTGRVWVNPDQYFDGVPLAAWEFHVGGYRPAQKWLKDRKGKRLSYRDIGHYQRMIKALSMTCIIMEKLG